MRSNPRTVPKVPRLITLYESGVDLGIESIEGEKTGVHGSGFVQREGSKEIADGRGELESMSTQSRGHHDRLSAGNAIDHEVLVS